VTPAQDISSRPAGNFPGVGRADHPGFFARPVIHRWRSAAVVFDDVTMWKEPGRNLFAGLMVAIVALPLALGFGVSSGLGAAAGLTTAIVAGAVAAVFGGSRLQVTGPTGAMTVVLVPIVHRHGAQGILLVGLMAGAMLLILAAVRAGRLIHYVPAPVIQGFTIGIAVVIFLQQVPAAIGVTPAAREKVLEVAWAGVTDFAASPPWTSLALGAGVTLVVLAGSRWRPGIPFSLVAVIGATVGSLGLGVARIGQLPAALPAPSLSFFDAKMVTSLVVPAMTVALLGALESLLSARMADEMAGPGPRHRPDRELFGQGLANLVVPLFGGVPATAAIARTAVNVRSGASTKLAALSHALILAVIMLVAAPLVAMIPLAALAGVLLATAVRMVETHAVKRLAKWSWHDAWIMGATALSTLVFDLMIAVGIGLVLTLVATFVKVIRGARFDTRHDLERQVIEVSLVGPLIFATAEGFRRRLALVPAGVTEVAVRLDGLTTVDTTGAKMLHESAGELALAGVTMRLEGIRPEHLRLLKPGG
jgi:SulP family sulfate permease